MCILIVNFMVFIVEEGLKVVSVLNFKIIFYRDGFLLLGEGFDVMETDNKSY